MKATLVGHSCGETQEKSQLVLGVSGESREVSKIRQRPPESRLGVGCPDAVTHKMLSPTRSALELVASATFTWRFSQGVTLLI